MTVLVADDHPLFRDGIVRAIRERPDLELVGQAHDGATALAHIRELAPAVAILDFSLPELDGLQVLAAVRRDGLVTRVLMLSASTEGPIVHQAIAAGAAGYLAKSADRADVCDAVAAVARGETVLDPSLQAGLLAQVRAHGVDDSRPVLTSREHEILALMASGLNTNEIGKQLFVAPSTVKTHVGHVYEKLEVSDRAACVAKAMRLGLLE